MFFLRLALLFALFLLMPIRGHAEKIISWWPLAFPSDSSQQARIQKEAERTIKLIDIPEDISVSEKTDIIRQFVHENSEHNMDKEFYSYWHDVPHMLSLMKRHKQNPLFQKPHAECSARSAMMYWLLQVMEIKSRIVVIRPDEDVTMSHTFLEIYNPQTQKWEISDPWYNLYWVFREDSRRAGVEDLLTYPIEETFDVCRTTNECGHIPLADAMPERFELAIFLDLEKNMPRHVINPERFSVNHPSWQNKPRMTYCDLFLGDCYGDIGFTGNMREQENGTTEKN